jgi:hypothetical protein
MSIEKLQDVYDIIQYVNKGYMHGIAADDLRKVIKKLWKVDSSYHDMCRISEIFCDSLTKINRKCTFSYDIHNGSKIVRTFSYPGTDAGRDNRVAVQIEYCNKGYTICCHPYDRSNMISFWLPYKVINNKRMIHNIAVYALNLCSYKDSKASSDMKDSKLCHRMSELEHIVHELCSKYDRPNGIGETDPSGFDLWLKFK